MNEAQHQDRVADLLRLKGYLVFHQRPARTNDGWRSAVAYDGKGFPDIVAVAHTGCTIIIECKGDKGRFSPEQDVWGDRFDKASDINEHVHYFISRPRNWDSFVAWLENHTG